MPISFNVFLSFSIAHRTTYAIITSHGTNCIYLPDNNDDELWFSKEIYLFIRKNM